MTKYMHMETALYSAYGSVLGDMSVCGDPM